MPTSVHIPKPLLTKLERRAKHLRISRNRLIVQAIEKDLAASQEWSSDFFDQLATSSTSQRAAVDEMLQAIHKQRRSKKALPF